MGRPITGGAGEVYAILKARMTSQLSSKTMTNSNWRTCTFTEVRGDIQGRIKNFFNGGWLIPIAKIYVNLFQVVLGLAQNMAIKQQ